MVSLLRFSHPSLKRYKCPKCRSPFCCVQCSKDHKANHCPANKSNQNENGDDYVSKQQSDNTSAAASTAIASSSTGPQSKYLPVAAFAQASSLPKKKRKRRSNLDDDDYSDNDEPGWNITAEMKQLIQRSDWLRKELEDGGLRHLIEQIDAASDDDGEEDNNSNKRRNNRGGNGQNNSENGNMDISQRVLALARTKHSHPKFATFIDRLLVTAGVLIDGSGGGGNGEAGLFEGGGLGESGRLELVPVPRRGGELIAAAGGKVESRSVNEDIGSDEESDSSDEDDSDESITE